MDTIMSAKRGETPDVDSPEAKAAAEKEAERKARHERSKRIAAERKAKETLSKGAGAKAVRTCPIGWTGCRLRASSRMPPWSTVTFPPSPRKTTSSCSPSPNRMRPNGSGNRRAAH
jgi:hypothetical protein